MREEQEQDGQQDTDQGITEHHRPVRIQGGIAGILQQLCQRSTHQGTGGGGKGTHQVIPGKDLGALFIRHQLRESSLLDGQKWTNLVAGGADHPNDRRHHQEDEVTRQAEDHPCHDHQQRSNDQHPAPAHPVSGGGEPQGDAGITCQGEGEQQADLSLTQAALCQV